MKAHIITVILISVLAACDSPGIINGTCDHTYEDPIIHIDQVTDVITSAPIAFQITSALIDTIVVDVTFLIHPVSYNVLTFDSTLICNTPCGFGTAQGTYTLFISAPNYKDTIIVIEAKYAVFNGGCPSSNSGGTVSSFQLTPE